MKYTFLIWLLLFLYSIGSSQAQEKNKWTGFFNPATFNEGLEEQTESLLKVSQVISPENAKKELLHKEGKKVHIPRVKQRQKALDKNGIFNLIQPSFVTFSSAYNCGNCNRTHINPASGYIIGEDGYIVTNYHILESYATPESGTMLGMVVITADRELYAVSDIVATFKDADLAIVKVDTKGKKLTPLPIGETAKVGDDIYILSHPFPAFNYFSTGYVTRNYLAPVSLEKPVLLPNTDVSADYAGGSSGAPIVDRYGNLVSTVCATSTINESGQPKNTQMVLKVTKPVVLLKELITFP